MTSYVIGVLGLVALTLGWAAVQGAWRRTFDDAGSDPDALAGRAGCSACTCKGEPEACERERLPQNMPSRRRESR